MAAYLLRRLLQVVPVVAVVVVLNFALIRLAPGDPTYYMIGDAPVSDEIYREIRAKLGLDQPLLQQLLVYASDLARGDLGYSYVSREAVATRIGDRIPATLLLMLSQLVVAAIVGVTLGTVAARRPGSRTDAVVSVVSVFGYAMPVFWLGQLLILVFAVELDLLPAQGMFTVRGDVPRLLDVAQHLILPLLTLALFNVALIARVTRASVIDVMDEDYVRVARAKGLGEPVVMSRHVLRNALLPVVTVIGLNVRNLIAGAVLTETVFGWPGIGRLTYDSIFARDYPVLLGILLLTAAVVGIGNLITDLVYGSIDPRVRLR